MATPAHRSAPLGDPSMWEAVLADPSIPLDRELVAMIAKDQRRPSRRWLYPLARPASRILVWWISLAKRLVPRRWMRLTTMDALCLWFLRRFVAPDAVELLLRLDIQTALCLMNIPFAMALDLEEFRRAVHSLRFDDSLLEILAAITGDETFRHWKVGGLSLWMDSNVDVPQMVYRHALVCEYAHAHLRRTLGVG